MLPDVWADRPAVRRCRQWPVGHARAASGVSSRSTIAHDFEKWRWRAETGESKRLDAWRRHEEKYALVPWALMRGARRENNNKHMPTPEVKQIWCTHISITSIISAGIMSAKWKLKMAVVVAMRVFKKLSSFYNRASRSERLKQFVFTTPTMSMTWNYIFQAESESMLRTRINII